MIKEIQRGNSDLLVSSWFQLIYSLACFLSIKIMHTNVLVVLVDDVISTSDSTVMAEFIAVIRLNT